MLLVTGATGYLGRHLTPLLDREGIEWAGVSLRESANPRIHRCDLTDPAATRYLLAELRPGKVVHTAAIVPKTADAYHHNAAQQANVAMLDHLLHALSPNCRMILCSSMTVYHADMVMPVGEDQADGRQLSAYGTAKWQAEQRLIASPLQATLSLRLPGLFGGDRQGGLIHQLLVHAAAGTPPILPVEPLFWAAMRVEDAASAILQLLKLPDWKHRVMNLGYEGAFSVNRLLEAVNRLYGVDLRDPIRHPDFAMRLDRLHDAGIHLPPFTKRLEDYARHLNPAR